MYVGLSRLYFLVFFRKNTFLVGVEVFESDTSSFGYTVESIVGKHGLDPGAAKYELGEIAEL